jgi:hypothetical protein
MIRLSREANLRMLTRLTPEQWECSGNHSERGTWPPTTSITLRRSNACFAIIDPLESWRVCFHFLNTIKPIQAI